MKSIYLMLVFLTAVLISANPDTGSEENSLIPPDAQQKAIQALRKLGPDRGALSISYKVVPIIGVVSEINLDTAEIKQNLQDLNAKIIGSEIKIALSGDVLFDFDKWNIRKDAEAELNKIIDIIKASRSSEITISGHTDSKGSEEYNLNLSLKRARAVKNWLIANSSISETSFKINGYGETRPVAPNENKDGSDNSEGRQKNRRVEFSIKIIKK